MLDQGLGSPPKATRQVTLRASPREQPAAPSPGAAAAAVAAPPRDDARQVWFDAEKQVWVAEVRLGGRSIPVGTFKSEAEALHPFRATLEAARTNSEAVAPGGHPCLSLTRTHQKVTWEQLCCRADNCNIGGMRVHLFTYVQ